MLRTTGAIMLTAFLVAAPSFAQDNSAVISNALHAAATSIAENATVMYSAEKTLREGTNGTAKPLSSRRTRWSS